MDALKGCSQLLDRSKRAGVAGIKFQFDADKSELVEAVRKQETLAGGVDGARPD